MDVIIASFAGFCAGSGLTLAGTGHSLVSAATMLILGVAAIGYGESL